MTTMTSYSGQFIIWVHVSVLELTHRQSSKALEKYESTITLTLLSNVFNRFCKDKRKMCSQVLQRLHCKSNSFMLHNQGSIIIHSCQKLQTLDLDEQALLFINTTVLKTQTTSCTACVCVLTRWLRHSWDWIKLLTTGPYQYPDNHNENPNAQSNTHKGIGVAPWYSI